MDPTIINNELSPYAQLLDQIDQLETMKQDILIQHANIVYWLDHKIKIRDATIALQSDPLLQENLMEMMNWEPKQ